MLLACVALVAATTARESRGYLARPTLHDAMNSMVHVTRRDLPTVPLNLFEVSRRGRADAPYCGDTIIPLQLTEDAPCNVSVGVCTEDGGKTWSCNATALLNGTADKVRHVGMHLLSCRRVYGSSGYLQSIRKGGRET